MVVVQQDSNGLVVERGVFVKAASYGTAGNTFAGACDSLDAPVPCHGGLAHSAKVPNPTKSERAPRKPFFLCSSTPLFWPEITEGDRRHVLLTKPRSWITPDPRLEFRTSTFSSPGPQIRYLGPRRWNKEEGEKKKKKGSAPHPQPASRAECPRTKDQAQAPGFGQVRWLQICAGTSWKISWPRQGDSRSTELFRLFRSLLHIPTKPPLASAMLVSQLFDSTPGTPRLPSPYAGLALPMDPSQVHQETDQLHHIAVAQLEAALNVELAHHEKLQAAQSDPVDGVAQHRREDVAKAIEWLSEHARYVPLPLFVS